MPQNKARNIVNFSKSFFKLFFKKQIIGIKTRQINS